MKFSKLEMRILLDKQDDAEYYYNQEVNRILRKISKRHGLNAIEREDVSRSFFKKPKIFQLSNNGLYRKFRGNYEEAENYLTNYDARNAILEGMEKYQENYVNYLKEYNVDDDLIQMIEDFDVYDFAGFIAKAGTVSLNPSDLVFVMENLRGVLEEFS